MAVKVVAQPRKYIGLSTDTKPTQASDASVREGSTYYEYNTKLTYITYDKINWVIKNDSDVWQYGTPTLSASNNAKATWFKSGTSPFDQKSSTSFLADLYGGVQTGDDWARVNIPINDVSLPYFNAAQWSYYLTNTEVYGVNIVIWAHDPGDPDNRIEITQAPSGITLDKAAGWNSHVLDTTTVQFFFYGENTTGTGLAAGTQYTWAQFQSDVLFSTWDIYRITLEWGWYSTGTFESAYVADIKLDSVLIPLYPDTHTFSRVVNVQKVLEAEGTYTANDVMSESDTNGNGTPWVFDMGGTGKLTHATVATPTARTSSVALEVYGAMPTCELDDNAGYNGPLVADLPFYIGRITNAALTAIGGISTTQTTLASPMPFDSSRLFVVSIDLTGQDFGDDTTFNVILSAEIDGA